MPEHPGREPADTRPLVLFDCTANICRSPMAEGLLRDHLPRDSRWRVMSAGLAAIPGD